MAGLLLLSGTTFTKIYSGELSYWAPTVCSSVLGAVELKKTGSLSLRSWLLIVTDSFRQYHWTLNCVTYSARSTDVQLMEKSEWTGKSQLMLLESSAVPSAVLSVTPLNAHAIWSSGLYDYFCFMYKKAVGQRLITPPWWEEADPGSVPRFVNLKSPCPSC